MTESAYRSDAACPTPAQLNLLVAGVLDDVSCDSIGDHLEQCEQCSRSFEERTAAHREQWGAWERLLDSGETTSPSTPAQPVPHVPGYEIIGELGRGGMGLSTEPVTWHAVEKSR